MKTPLKMRPMYVRRQPANIPVASLYMTREEANTLWLALKQFKRTCEDDQLDAVNVMLAKLETQATNVNLINARKP